MNILVPLNRFDYARVQAESVATLVSEQPCKVIAASVIKPAMIKSGRYGYDELMEQRQQEEMHRARRLLLYFRDRLPDIEVEEVICCGDPLQQLTAIRYQHSVDLIVLAQKRKMWPFSAQAFSFSRSLGRKARCETVINEIAGDKLSGSRVTAEAMLK